MIQDPPDPRKIATLTGWLMVVTFATSIPAYFTLYARCGKTPRSVTGAGAAPIRLSAQEVFHVSLIGRTAID